jgi:hypothetical protein
MMNPCVDRQTDFGFAHEAGCHCYCSALLCCCCCATLCHALIGAWTEDRKGSSNTRANAAAVGLNKATGCAGLHCSVKSTGMGRSTHTPQGTTVRFCHVKAFASYLNVWLVTPWFNRHRQIGDDFHWQQPRRRVRNEGISMLVG